jgi:putative oxidoreductase
MHDCFVNWNNKSINTLFIFYSIINTFHPQARHVAAPKLLFLRNVMSTTTFSPSLRTLFSAQHAQPELAALLLRLTLGVILIAHGLLKVLVFTLPGAAGFFTSIGFPGWLAYVVTGVELAAGLALVLGWQSRAAALVSLPVLLGASYVHAGNGWLFTNKNGGWEYPVVLVLLAVTVALLGNGAGALQRPSR